MSGMNSLKSWQFEGGFAVTYVYQSRGHNPSHMHLFSLSFYSLLCFQGSGSALGTNVTSVGKKQPPSVRCAPALFASSIGKGCSSFPNLMGVCLVLNMTPVGPTLWNLGRSVSMCLPQCRCLQAPARTWQSNHQKLLLRGPRCQISHLLMPIRSCHSPKKLWQGLVRGHCYLKDLWRELTPAPSF